jgi:hypothetical protein
MATCQWEAVGGIRVKTEGRSLQAIKRFPFLSGQTVPVVVDGQQIDEIAVDDMLP